jgi:hypothetical protein
MAESILNAGSTAGGALYREFKFLPSHTVSLDLQCGVSRLEVPVTVLQEMTDIYEECFVCAHVISSLVHLISLRITLLRFTSLLFTSRGLSLFTTHPFEHTTPPSIPYEVHYAGIMF